jgi:Mor family transcriptional regulator
MKWIEELNTIYQKLGATGFEEVKKEILKAQMSGHGGETYYLVLQQLILIKKDKVQIYELIKGEVESIIHFSKHMIHLN